MKITEIKKIRQTMGFSQEEFSKELGISRIAISNLETGLYEPSPATIKKLIAFCQKNKIRITR